MGRHLNTVIAVALAAIWGFAIYFEHGRGRLGFLDRLESITIDIRTLVRGVRVPPDLVTIVEIDDAVVKQRGVYPLARTDLARMVETIARLQPKVIAIDLLLVDNSTQDADESLARSLAAHPCVIAAAAIFPDSSQSVPAENEEGPLARLPLAEAFLLPIRKFADHAQIGIVNVATDRTGTPRSIPMLFRSADMIELSFALRVASQAVGTEPTIEPNRLLLDQRSIPTDLDHALPITFYGPRRTIRTIGAASVLAGDVAADVIRNRIVVIGSTVAGGADFFSTPFEPLLPGVEVISTAITHLVAGDGPLRDQSVRTADGVVAVLLPAVLLSFLAWRRSAAGIIAATAAILIWVAAIFLAFSSGILMSVAVPAAAAAVPVVLFGSFQLWSGRRQAQYFATRSELLEQFQAPAIQRWLTRDPNFLANPVRQNAAIVFIDLSGFTSLSEQLGPDRIQGSIEGLSRPGRQGSCHLRRNDNEFFRRWGHDFVRPAERIAAGRIESSRLRAPSLQERTAMADFAGAVSGFWTWIQGRCPFRDYRSLPARRRKLSAHHGDWRYRQRSQPPDGSGGKPWRGTCAERRIAPRSGAGVCSSQIGRFDWTG